MCPFCQGHEDKTPPEILAYRNGGGWDVRVVPNKFPALRVEGDLDREGEGLFDRMNGIGAHEVIIETPHHGQTLATMGEPAIEKVFWAWRERVLDLKRDIRLRHIVIFKNHGASAGASLEHSHSQLIALPIVPRELKEELHGAKRHFQQRERCVFCDIVRQESREGTRVIAESADFVALSPYAPRFPFETWLAAEAAPVAIRRHDARRVREPCADAQGHPAADERDAAVAAVQSDRPQRAASRRSRRERVLSLAHRGDAEAHARGRLRVGDRVLHQSDGTGRSGGRVEEDENLGRVGIAGFVGRVVMRAFMALLVVAFVVLSVLADRGRSAQRIATGTVAEVHSGEWISSVQCGDEASSLVG